MTAPEPHPSLSAAGLIEMLQQIARANYEQAALNQSSGGETHELVADVMTRANPAGWSRYARELPAAEVADQIGASLFIAKRDLPDNSPARHAIDLVHRQIHSMRDTHRG